MHQHFEQLVCRMLIQMTWSFPMDTTATSAILGQSTMRDEATSSCIRLVHSFYSQLDSEDFVASLPLGFDLFSAAVTILCHASTFDAEGAGLSTQISAVMHNCTTVLTVIGERLPSLKPLGRVVQALFKRASVGLGSSDLVSSQNFLAG